MGLIAMRSASTSFLLKARSLGVACPKLNLSVRRICFFDLSRGACRMNLLWKSYSLMLLRGECGVNPSALPRWGQEVHGYRFGNFVEWLIADGDITIGQVVFVIGPHDRCTDDGSLYVRFRNCLWSFTLAEQQRVSVDSGSNLGLISL